MDESSKNADLAWELPKGQKDRDTFLRESDMECAIREFTEETGMPRDKYKLLFDCPTMRHSIEYDRVLHKMKFFCAIGNAQFEPHINFKKEMQYGEILDVQWRDINFIEFVRYPLADQLKKLFRILKKDYKLSNL